MRMQVKAEALGELRLVVAHVIVGDAREAVLAQRRGDAIRIGAPHLVRLDALAGLDELVARGDHDDHRLRG